MSVKNLLTEPILYGVWMSTFLQNSRSIAHQGIRKKSSRMLQVVWCGIATKELLLGPTWRWHLREWWNQSPCPKWAPCHRPPPHCTHWCFAQRVALGSSVPVWEALLWVQWAWVGRWWQPGARAVDALGSQETLCPSFPSWWYRASASLWAISSWQIHQEEHKRGRARERPPGRAAPPQFCWLLPFAQCTLEFL